MTNDKQTLELIRAVEEANSSQGLLDAVKALSDARTEAAIDTLITVLGYNNPGAAVAAVDGLIALGESAVQPLLKQLDDYNYGARAWAVRALAGIGDPRGLDILMNAAATDFALSVRRAAARGLGSIRWSGLSADKIPPAQAKTLDTLLQVSQDPEWVVRYAAVVGLEALAIKSANYIPQVQAHFKQMAESEVELAVRARVVLAQQRLVAMYSMPQSV